MLKLVVKHFWQTSLILVNNISCWRSQHIYRVAICNMQINSSKIQFMAAFVHGDSAPLSMNLAHRSFVGGRSDDLLLISASSSSSLLELIGIPLRQPWPRPRDAKGMLTREARASSLSLCYITDVEERPIAQLIASSPRDLLPPPVRVTWQHRRRWIKGGGL
jgi:hypothetical protein